MLRKMFASWAISLMVASTGSIALATNTCVVPSASLVSWWTGDNDESDLYGLNNASGVNGVTLVPAKVGNGFTFGTDGYIDILPASSLANKKFTLAAWVMPNGPGPNDDYVGSAIFGQSVGDFQVAVTLDWRATPDYRFVYQFGNVNTEVIYSNDTFPPGSFYFVAGTYDGSTFRLYVNGVLEGTYSETKTISYSTETWTIGSTSIPDRNNGFPRTWNGIIDEVQAYKAALSQTQLTSIYKAGPLGECKGPVVTTPTKLAFAAETLSTTSVAKTISILNNRDVTLTMDGFSFGGNDPNDFAVSSTTCGSTLLARKTCKVSITFTPQATGSRTAILNIKDNATGSPQTVPLAGTGQ